MGNDSNDEDSFFESQGRSATSIRTSKTNPVISPDVQRILPLDDYDIRTSKTNPVISPDVQRILPLDDYDWIEAVRSDNEFQFTSSDDDDVIIQGLEAMDWITGRDMSGTPFLVQQVSLSQQNGDRSSTWVVRDGSLDEIFDQLDLEASLDMTSSYLEEGDPETRRLGLFDVEVSESVSETLSFLFVAEAELGPADLTFTSEFRQYPLKLKQAYSALFRISAT